MTKNASQFQKTQSGVLSNKIYYRSRGRQVVKAYPALINNPRTNAQMAVRVSLANMNNLFRIIAQVVPIIFEGKNKRQSANNCFTSINKNIVPVYLNKSEAALNCCVITDYIVSRGSLLSFGQLINELSEINTDHLWGVKLDIDNYTGSNMQSLRNAMKKTFRDYKEKECIYIAFIYGEPYSVKSRGFKIQLSEENLPDGVIFRDDGYLYIEITNEEWRISGCVFIRRSIGNNGHLNVSSQRLTPSNGFMPPEYKRSTLPYQEAAITTYKQK